MATVNLYLKHPKADKKTNVHCIISDGRKVRLKIQTPIYLHPKYWSKENKCILPSYEGAKWLNEELRTFKLKAYDFYFRAKKEGIEPTSAYISELMNPKKIATLSKKFWPLYDQYLEIKSNKLSISSIKKIKSLKKHLISFEKSHKTFFNLDTIDLFLFEKLQSYFYKDLDLNTQTTAKYLGLFKSFLNWCKAMKLTTNEDHKLFELTHQPDTLKPILTDDEIASIKQLDLQDRELHTSRQLLLLSIYTGLRYSDYSKLHPSHLKVDHQGYEYLSIRQTKTFEFIEVPVNETASKILKSLFKGEIRALHNVIINRSIKEVCRLAGIDETFEVFEFKGPKVNVFYKPKYELITTHTGRRTFATRLLLRGIPTKTVMKFTGHRDERSFSKYVNIPKEREMDMVRRALF